MSIINQSKDFNVEYPSMTSKIKFLNMFNLLNLQKAGKIGNISIKKMETKVDAIKAILKFDSKNKFLISKTIFSNPNEYQKEAVEDIYTLGTLEIDQLQFDNINKSEWKKIKEQISNELSEYKLKVEEENKQKTKNVDISMNVTQELIPLEDTNDKEEKVEISNLNLNNFNIKYENINIEENQKNIDKSSIDVSSIDNNLETGEIKIASSSYFSKKPNYFSKIKKSAETTSTISSLNTQRKLPNNRFLKDKCTRPCCLNAFNNKYKIDEKISQLRNLLNKHDEIYSESKHKSTYDNSYLKFAIKDAYEKKLNELKKLNKFNCLNYSNKKNNNFEMVYRINDIWKNSNLKNKNIKFIINTSPSCRKICFNDSNITSRDVIKELIQFNLLSDIESIHDTKSNRKILVIKGR